MVKAVAGSGKVVAAAPVVGARAVSVITPRSVGAARVPVFSSYDVRDGEG